MMGERPTTQEALFYKNSLDRHVPTDHLLRSIDRFVDLSSTARWARRASSNGREPTGQDLPDDVICHISPQIWGHINLT